MRNLVTVLLGLLVLSSAKVTAGHQGAGGLSLTPGLSAKAISMGQTGLVESGWAEAFVTNPASLPFFDAPEIALGHSDLAEGLKASATAVAAVYPLGASPGMPQFRVRGHEWGLGLAYQHRSVKLSQGSDWSCGTLGAGVGYRPRPYASVGLLTKLLFTGSDLENTGARGLGADLGALLELSPRLSLGVVLRNLAGSIRWDDGEDEPAPLGLSLGGRIILWRSISADLALHMSRANPTQVGLGIDLPVLDTGFHARGGYLYRGGDYSRQVMTAGFGACYQRLRLDYAVRLEDDQATGITHHFSLGYTAR
jgi:hypothetical protein